MKRTPTLSSGRIELPVAASCAPVPLDEEGSPVEPPDDWPPESPNVAAVVLVVPVSLEVVVDVVDWSTVVEVVSVVELSGVLVEVVDPPPGAVVVVVVPLPTPETPGVQVKPPGSVPDAVKVTSWFQ